MDISFLENLPKLNTATKYPSIPTYHALGEKGKLKEEILVSFEGEKELIYTEKIDGTNARIILFPDGDFFIGSREELLYFGGDLIFNPAQNIVKTLIDTANNLSNADMEADNVYVLYSEVYGHKIGKNAKSYTSEKNIGFRVFDITRFESENDLLSLLDMPIEQISSWREHGNQTYLSEYALNYFANEISEKITPRIAIDKKLPTTIEETYKWLQEALPGRTCAALDGEGGIPEGIVVRTPDRSKIAKIRFEDYKRTLRKR